MNSQSFLYLFRWKHGHFTELEKVYIFEKIENFLYRCFLLLSYFKNKRKTFPCAYFLLFCNLLKWQFRSQQNSFRKNCMLDQPLVFTGCSFPDTVIEKTQGTTTHCAASGSYTILLFTWVFPPNPYLGKKRISQVSAQFSIPLYVASCLSHPLGHKTF